MPAKVVEESVKNRVRIRPEWEIDGNGVETVVGGSYGSATFEQI
jgi:hypothetical protein